MNKKLKPASRLTIVFILAVVISGSILTWFSINSISNLKELTEKRILEEQRELTVRFSSAIQNQIEKVTAGFIDEISPVNLIKDSLINTSNAHGFITVPFILKNNGTFIFPNFNSIPENKINPKFSNRFNATFAKGERAEFATKNLKTAKKQYLLCLSYSSGINDSVKAINALGRVSVKLNEYQTAIDHYKLIILNHFPVLSEVWIPYVYFAIPQLLKITNPGNCEEIAPLIEFCLEKITIGAVPLNFNTEELLNLVIEWQEENTFNNPENLSNINKLEMNINQQLQFINKFKNELSEFIKKGDLDNHINVGNDFKVVNSFPGNSQELLLLNTNLENYPGFLINGKKLFDSILNTNSRSELEFEYNIEFLSGYNSNINGENLIYSAQLNPYFPGQIIQIKLKDENLIKDFIKRRSWIYGIAAAFLMVALFLGVALIVRDIAREKNLARLQADFISNVTHELKTPLTSINMFAELLFLKRVKKESDKEEYLSIILKESERLKRMINNILDFSKSEKGKQKYYFVHSNLATILQTAIQEMEYWIENENFDLTTEIDENIYAEVDIEKMKQVMINLLSNAIKYSTDSKRIFVRLYTTINELKIEVEDRGIGLSKDQLPRIFEKFYRADQKEGVSGTGLGLTVVQEIIEAHGGKITVSSKIGKGSIFSITLNHQLTKA